MQILVALLSGILFGAGLAISGMANPAKVLNFFDIAGTWDPSLALVMAGALAVTLVGYRLVLRRAAPIFAQKFHVPSASHIDMRLIGGAALFGLGWGLSGFCPGPAIASLTTLSMQPVIFIIAMLAGMLVAKLPVLPKIFQPGGSRGTAS
jgi:uncharacterized membrane protein YedE/YeeE